MRTLRVWNILGYVSLLAAFLAVPAVWAADPAPGAATAAPPALGTTTTTTRTAPQHTAQLGKIEVTGSAIPRTSIETEAPVTQITARQIQESGLTTVADVVRSITSDNSGTIPTAFTAGFAAGSSGIALRGLTVNSTLVLIDGRRTAAYALADDGQRSFTDLNSIPLNAVERIEVLKDGASSIYGADAIAGVVNIILYKTFDHSEVAAEVGTSQHGGGTTRRVTFLSGTGDLDQDKYNAYMNFEYEKDDPIHDSQRDFPYNTNDLRSIGGVDDNVGNPFFAGSNIGAVAPGTVTGGNLLTGVQDQNSLYQPLNSCGAGSTLVSQGGTGRYCEQNFVSMYSEIVPEVDRVGLSGRITLKLSDATTATTDLSFFQDRVVATAAPSQIQTTVPNNTDAIALPPTLLDGRQNPNDPFAAQGKYALISYSFGDIPGGSTNVNHVMRMVEDVKGSFGDSGWDWDGALDLNHTWLNVNNYGFLSFNQLLTDINTGAYNFVNPSKNSAATLTALSPVLSKTSTSDMDSLDFSANRSLMDLSGGSLGLAIGAQYRYEAQDDPDLNPSDAFQGLGIAHTIGQRTVTAVYAELDAPVLTSLDLNLAAREDHYSDFGSAFSPKFGFKYTPVDSFALRGTYSKGFRAPSFAENGSSASEGFITEDLPSAFVAAHGHDPYTQPYSLGLLTSGNASIQPERSRNYTFGTIFQPTDDFSGTLDYYNIEKTGVISAADPSLALNAYFAGQPIPAGYTLTSDLPDPNDRTGLARPVLVSSPYVNASELKTSGLDLGLKYREDFGSFDWSSDFEATDILTFAQTAGDGSLVSYVGTQAPYILSSGAGTPKYRASWANSFTFGAFTITPTFYYVSGIFMSADDATGPGTEHECFSTNTPTGANQPADCRVPSFTYMDLTAEFHATDDLSVNAGILNFFDRKAPFDPIDYAGVNYNPTFEQTGAVGRFFTLGLKYKF
ncbi:MAG TPA: TonB-dependent receptor [Gammaproteobacteria bacterium]|jgi:iron complex outermembrane receptor protein